MRRANKAARKSKGAPTWMVTFGDLMALLFTLFVLLFTYSTIDATKYKALAGSLREAFGSSTIDTFIGDKGGSMEIIPLPEELTDEEKLEVAEEIQERKAIDLERELKTAIESNLPDAGINVEREGGRILIRFPSKIAFFTGSAEVTTEFGLMLRSLTPILVKAPGAIIVGGHTDNIPISPGAYYRSNWELSAARAAAVVHVLLEDPNLLTSNLTIQGFGDSRPLVDNTTLENRALNRRVEISILTDDPGLKPNDN